MANHTTAGKFTVGNQAAKGRKNRFTDMFHRVVEDTNATERITKELIDMFFSESIPVKEKRMIGEFLLNKLIISAEKQTDLDIAAIESKSKEEIMIELLNKAGGANVSIQKEEAIHSS